MSLFTLPRVNVATCFRKVKGSLGFVASVVLIAVSPLAQGANVPEINLKQMQEQVRGVSQKTTPATVALISARGDTGSGVIVSADGLVLTAAHVVQGDEEMKAILPDGRVEKARVLGANYTRDAAMVQIEGGKNLPHVELGDSDALHVGDFVVALGHSKGYDPGRRAPVRLGRLSTDGKQRFLITECTLIGGDSGGPLFDLQGKLVGIHSSIGSKLTINNHVPISTFKDNWDKLLRGEQWGQLGLHPMADPETPVLGFSMAYAHGIDGVIVDDILVKSPADQAGLEQGDVVTHINDRRIANPRDMIRELGSYRPGEAVNLIVVRRGETYKAPLTLGRRGDLMQRRRNH
jgi:serine protease Do